MEKNKCSSKLAFIYLPFTTPSMPPLGIPLLSAFMRVNNIECLGYDLNIEFYNLLIDRKRIKRKCIEIKEKLDKYNLFKYLEKKKYADYISCLKLFMKSKILNTKLEEAIDIYRRKKTIGTSKELYFASQVISTALEISTYNLGYINNNPANYFVTLDYNNYKQLENDESWREFIDWFYCRLDKICSENEIISFSWCYYTQIHFLLLASSYIKKVYPNKNVVVGGPVATGIIKESDVNIKRGFFSEYNKLFDIVIMEDGEYPLVDFLKKKKNSKIYRTPNFKGDDVNKDLRVPSIIKPDYNILPIELYLTPNLVLPFITSRHCYWGKCKFCTHSLGYSKYEKYSSKEIIIILKEVLEEQNINSIYFVDEGMAVNTAIEISKGVINQNIDIKWMTQMRFEKLLESIDIMKLLSLGGCKYIAFGMESANDRILKCMNKGTNKESIKIILENCANSNIYANTMFFFGFPTETKIEAYETFKFIIENEKNIAGIGMGYFTLTPHSYIYDNPSEFGLYNVDDSGNYDVTAGITKDEAQEFYIKCEKYINSNFYRGQAFYHRTIYLISLENDNSDTLIGYPLGFTKRESIINYHTERRKSISCKYKIDKNLVIVRAEFDFYNISNNRFYLRNNELGYFCYNCEIPLEKIIYISEEDYRVIKKNEGVVWNDNKEMLVNLLREGIITKDEE